MNETSSEIKIYVCYEPEQDLLASRIDGWVRTDPHDPYAQRAGLGPQDAGAEALRLQAQAAIAAAEVVVCVISQTAARDAWIAWELETARSCDPPRPLVGVLTAEYNPHPRAMVNRGAVFVPFRRDIVDRGIRWAHQMQASDDDFTLKDF